MNSQGIWLLVAVSFLILFAACQPTEDTITVGVVAPLSGSFAEFGQATVNAIELAANNRSDIELIIEDGKCDASTSNTIIQRLIEYEDIDYLIGGVCSSETLAMEPFTSRNEIVHISSVSSSPDLTDTPVIRLYPSDVYRAQQGIRILEEIGAEHVGVLYLNNDYGVALRDEFADKWSGTYSAQAVTPDSTDYRTQILKLTSEPIDALYVIGALHEPAIAAKQLEELGIDVQLVAGDSVRDPRLFDIAGEDAVQGMLFYSAVEENTPESQRFQQMYGVRFGSEPNIYAPYGYDSMRVLLEGIGNTDGSYNAVRSYLIDNEFVLATGSINFDANGDVQKKYATMKVSGTDFVNVG